MEPVRLAPKPRELKTCVLVHRFHETARLFRIQLAFDSLNGVEDHDSMAAGD